VILSAIRKLCTAALIGVYVVMALVVTALSGCKSLTPTRVPPLAKEIGYIVPNYKGWTTAGINEAVYELEAKKLELLSTMIDTVNRPAYAIREQAIDWLNIALSGGLFGGIPLALRKLPRGAVRKEEHEVAVIKAGIQDPEEFRKTLAPRG
jgi:hypothetical protein